MLIDFNDTDLFNPNKTNYLHQTMCQHLVYQCIINKNKLIQKN